MPVQTETKAREAVDEIFTNLRDRRFLKWLFDRNGNENLIGRFDNGEELRGLDLEVQEDIKSSWANIIANTFDTPAQPESVLLAEAVKVKPLEWEGDFAHTTFGLFYYIEHATGVPGYVVLEKHSGSSTTKSGWETIAEAKAAAQADYEQRIRSALAAESRAVPDGWRLVPEDLVTHLHDFEEACRIAKTHAVVSPPDIDDRSYWDKQLTTIAKVRAALAAPAQPVEAQDG